MKSCKAFNRRVGHLAGNGAWTVQIKGKTRAGRQSSSGSHAPLPGGTYIIYVKSFV